MAISLAACAGEDNLLKGVAKAGNFATTAATPRDFVQQSRPAELEYIPVGSRITRESKKMTPGEFKAIETELDTRRARNEAAGVAAKAAGATPPPAPIKIQ